VAGVAFAWTPALVARSTGHFSLVAAAPLAAFLLCLIRADRSRRAFDAALAGACMAWAAFCDPYYAVYCLLIAAGYLMPRLMRVTWSRERGRVRWRWALNLMIVLLAGLIIGVSAGGGGRITVVGIPISVRGLYTPMLVMTALVAARLLVQLRPHLAGAAWTWSMRAARVVIIGGIACATLLSPVLYGLGTSIVEGRFASPPTLWRSSPRGVDLLSFIAVNPHHQIVRAIHDQQTADPAALAEFTAAVSLIALGVIGFAIWRGGYRPHRGWMWLTAGFAVLALGPFIYVAGVNTHVPGPWALLRYVPVIDAARAPTRFAIVAALGVAVLFAGALAAIGARYPRRRNLIAAAIGAALVFELSPVPRTLFSAEIPALYQIVAADRRPVRFMELPFGVRDGTFTVGNFSARYLYYQTVHEKRVIGGYLSRISKKRVDEIRAQPTLDALIRLSEGGVFTPDEYQHLRARGPRFIERSDLAWVVINHDTSPQPLVDFVIDAWRLQEVAREGPKVLYRPTL
jgi:hypothetical protein